MHDRRYKVVFVIPGRLGKGHMVFSHREAEALRRRGHDVKLFGLNLRYTPLQIFREWRRLAEFVRSERPDVVHAQFGKFNALLAALAVRRTPLVVTFRGTDVNVNPRYSKLRSTLGIGASHLAAWRAAAVICVSREIASKMVFRRRRIEVVPSGVDTDAFRPRDLREARTALGWPLDRPIILFNAGSNPVVKNLPLARAAVDRLRVGLPSVDFRVLDGTLDPDLVPNAMATADCLLVTSHSEGSPTVVQEAMACDLPVVSVAVGDVAERLEGVSLSRIVPHDVEALASALGEVLATGRRSDGSRRLGPCALGRVAEVIEGVYGHVVCDKNP